MAKVERFKAFRPNKEVVEKFVCPPYDVINTEEAREYAKGNDISFFHVTRSEIDFPEGHNPYDTAVYFRARENLEKFITDGVLKQDEKPMLYVYKEEQDGRTQVGIVGCVSIYEYEDDTIKKHELTRKAKEEDRIKHFDACDGNTEPVFLTYKKNDVISNILNKTMSEEEAEYDFVGSDNTRHRLWTVSDEKDLDTIEEAFKGIDSLYIADGHHRSASAYKVGKKKQCGSSCCGCTSGDSERFMAAVFASDELNILGYNRTLKANGLSVSEILKRIEEAGFTIEKLSKGQFPGEKRSFSMYIENEWYTIKAKDVAIPDDVVESLDVSILQNNILEPIFGIKDPRTDENIDFVGASRGIAELEKRADTDMDVSFALFPVSIESLMDISDAGKIMPPKSTWFEPKLISGLFLHLFHDR